MGRLLVRRRVAPLALALLCAGCGGGRDTLAPLAAPDSVRFVGQSDDATLLVWANGSVNLWLNAGADVETGYPVRRCAYRAAVVYGGRWAGEDTLTIPLVTSAGDSVTGGWARLARNAAGDTVWALADVELHGPCGSAVAQAPVTLVRAP